MNILKNIDGSTIYVSEGLPIGTKDGEGRSIVDGSVCVDTFNKFIYKLVSKKWTLQTTDVTLNVTTSTFQTTNTKVEDWYSTKLFEAKSKVKYTTTYNGSTTLNYVVPNAKDNIGKFIAFEDSLGLGICILNSNRTSTLYGFGGLGNGQVSTMYLYSDGDAWNIATIYLPNSNPYTNYSKEFQDKIAFVSIVVDDANGNDSSGKVGTDCFKFPFKTITQANFKATGNDVILVKSGTYIDNNIIPKSGLTILMLEGANIQPLSLRNTPIFCDSINSPIAYRSVNNSFTLLGKGKVISYSDMRDDATAIKISGINTKWYLELSELGSAQLHSNGYGERLSQLKIVNTKIIGYVGNYARASELICENCFFENAMLQNMYLEAINFATAYYPAIGYTQTRKYPHPTSFTGKKITFNKCTFIKTQIIPPMYTLGNYTGSRENYTDWDKNDLDIISYRSHQRNPNQGWRDSYDSINPANIPPVELNFISCKFINKVGGNAITLYINPSTLSNNRAFVSISDCQFYLTNENNPSQVNPMYNINTFGNDDSTTSNYLFTSNYSNVGNNATAPTVLTNQLPGTGFTINSNFTL